MLLGSFTPMALSAIASSVGCGTSSPIFISSSGFENTSSGVPSMTTLPWSKTRILSDSRAVSSML